MTNLANAIHTSSSALSPPRGLSNSAYALEGSWPVGVELRQLTQIKAMVLCTFCNLDNVRETQSNAGGKLY